MHKGIVRPDRRTKDLVKRLRSGEIALIDHCDVDRVSAEALMKCKVPVVLNTCATMSGRYPNPGPGILVDAGVVIVDELGEEVFELLKDGESITVNDGEIYRAGELLAKGTVLTPELVKTKLAQAETNLAAELEQFAKNTLEYLHSDSTSLLQLIDVPDVDVDIAGRHVLVVVRGHNFEEDLRALRSFVRDMKPVLIAVDGGADALVDQGLRPDIIVGDMDSVTDRTLKKGAQLIVHAYADGRAPGADRLDALGLKYQTFPAAATSEDVALLLAYEHGAELIVAVGTHVNLVDFLDKGRKGMASTFLTRLKVGTHLVDAKGVSELYKSRVPVAHLSGLMIAGVVTFAMIILLAPPIRNLVTLLAMRARLALGI